MVKTFKNLLLRNQKADDLETWYAASVLPSLFKWAGTDLIYGKVKFASIAFYMGEKA